MGADVDGAIGKELRRTRDDRCLTMQEIADLIDVTKQAYAHYEYGDRPCYVARLVQICTAFNASAPVFLSLAMQRAGIALYVNDILVDLEALADTDDETLAVLKVWARRRLDAKPQETVTGIPPEMVAEWATLLGMPRHDFVGRLLAVTPASVGVFE